MTTDFIFSFCISLKKENWTYLFTDLKYDDNVVRKTENVVMYKSLKKKKKGDLSLELEIDTEGF